MRVSLTEGNRIVVRRLAGDVLPERISRHRVGHPHQRVAAGLIAVAQLVHRVAAAAVVCVAIERCVAIQRVEVPVGVVAVGGRVLRRRGPRRRGHTLEAARLQALKLIVAICLPDGRLVLPVRRAVADRAHRAGDIAAVLRRPHKRRAGRVRDRRAAVGEVPRSLWSTHHDIALKRRKIPAPPTFKTCNKLSP